MLAEKPSFNNTLNTDWSIFAATRNPFWARMWHLSLNLVKRPVASNKEKRMKVLWFHFIIWHVPLSSKTRCSSRRWWRFVYVTMSKACTRLLRRYYRQFDVLSARKYRDWSENLKKKSLTTFTYHLVRRIGPKQQKETWKTSFCTDRLSSAQTTSALRQRLVMIKLDLRACSIEQLLLIWIFQPLITPHACTIKGIVRDGLCFLSRVTLSIVRRCMHISITRSLL